MLQIQYDFFKTEEECLIEALEKEIAAVRVSSDKVRRGMYAKLSELTKKNLDLTERLEIIERNLCSK